MPPKDAAPAVQSNCTATLFPCAIWRCRAGTKIGEVSLERGLPCPSLPSPPALDASLRLGALAFTRTLLLGREASLLAARLVWASMVEMGVDADKMLQRMGLPWMEVAG